MIEKRIYKLRKRKYKLSFAIRGELTVSAIGKHDALNVASEKLKIADDIEIFQLDLAVISEVTE